jgi:hypothetical protein
MRALCGAIITAGALLGLGLTAIGFGTRYQTGLDTRDPEGKPLLLKFSQMDRPLIFIMVFLTITAIVGLGISFLGLAYHHRHRHHELLRHGMSPEPHQHANV